MRKLTIVKSGFNKNEEFEYDEAPKHFKSVTEQSMRRLRRFCLRNIAHKYNKKYKPAALESMLESISGEFDAAYIELEGDYSTRYSNLKNAYNDGIADLFQSISQVETSIDEHNLAFEEYAQALELFNGGRPADQRISPKVLEDINEKYKELESKGDKNA